MTVHAPLNNPHAAVEEHEKTTTIEHDVSVQPEFQDDGEDNTISNGLRRKKYNKNLNAAQLGMSSHDWAAREKMAWAALIAMILLNVALFFLTDIAKITALGTILSWFDGAAAGIIGSYIGFKSFEIRGK